MKPKVSATGTPVARERRDGRRVNLSTFIPLKIRESGASKVVVRPDGAVESPGKVASGSEIAQREGLNHSTVNELLRLTLLEPAIIQSILAGLQPKCMSLLWFQRNPLPTDWVAQREVVVAFDS